MGPPLYKPPPPIAKPPKAPVTAPDVPKADCQGRITKIEIMTTAPTPGVQKEVFTLGLNVPDASTWVI
jgi:hypothetical protein